MLLVCAVVGSGIMDARLTDDVALILLGNTLATGAILVVLITALGPVSGAHFNPAVTIALALRRKAQVSDVAPYVLVQIVGGILGALLAHAMFEQEILQASQTVRTGPAQWLSEAVATFGLVFAIFAGIRHAPQAVPWMVGLYITAAYWFTASTSFANPAVTIARSFSDTFSGIRPNDLPGFLLAQIAGALIAAALASWLYADEKD
jgi:glycerol uptake facilitator-like aquaporin